MKDRWDWSVLALILAMLFGIGYARCDGDLDAFGFYGGGGLLGVIIVLVVLGWIGVL